MMGTSQTIPEVKLQKFQGLNLFQICIVLPNPDIDRPSIPQIKPFLIPLASTLLGRIFSHAGFPKAQVYGSSMLMLESGA